MVLLLLLFFEGKNVEGQLLYTDVIPDRVVSGMPLGTTDSVFVDADQNGQDDFVIICSTWYYFVHQTCCWCYRNEMVGLNPLNGVAQDTVTVSMYNCGRIFLDSGLCVGANYPYQNTALFSGSGPCNSCGPPDTVRRYFPFRISVGGNLFYGWFQLLATGSSLTLYDMAVNLTANTCVVTGQTVTGDPELHETRFGLYPNPAKGSFTVNLGKPIAKGNIQILTILGEQVSGNEISNTSIITFNLVGFSPGMYVAKVFDGEKYFFRKFMVEKY